MMAFQVTTWLDGPKNDPYFVKWMAILWIYEENEYRTVFIPTYKCTQKDMERLYPPAKMNMMVEELKKEGQLVCIDWESVDVDLYGTWASGDSYRALEIAAVPCHRRATLSDGTLSEIADDCNLDEKLGWEYLGQFNILVYANEAKIR